ncbi:MAG TPA: AMP-binding protein [Candidatus Limnocylindrales bacterium]
MEHDQPIFGRDGEGVAWRPSGDLLRDSRLARFLRATGEPGLEALQARAVTDPAWFWGAAADDLGLVWGRQPTSVLDASRGPAFARWWLGGELNYARAALDPRVAQDPDGMAITWEGEDGAIRQLTNRELAVDVDLAARRLHAHGVGPGDRVGILLPMLVETVVAVLALGRLRAVYTPIFSGYGAPAIATRLADSGATVLITADGFRRRGAWVGLKPVADAAVAEAPAVRRVLVVQRAAGAVATPWIEGRDAWWHERVPGEDDGPAPDAGSTTDPETPYMIIYTSGTTGRPKGAVHVHGGFPVKGAQDLAHQFDLGGGDTLFWFTDLGWMMGPWAISGALLRGARLVLYEGAPDFPGPDRLWSIVARHRVTHLGLSPTVIRALMAHGEEPVRGHDRSSLRVLGSTGEPWNPDPWWWYFRVVGEGRCPIINYSGGTEVSGGIVSGNVLGPIKPASFSGPCIGTAADVVDEAGRPVRGAVGELVIRAPMPGMTRGFWRDDEGRYEATYWSRFPGTWVHGDWATIDADGFWYIQGRSDDTLKVAGKRVGPAEVESAAVAHPAVLEAAAIGIPHEIKGEVVVVLAVLRPGETDDPALRTAVAETVADQLGKPLRPERVAVIPALPKTRSGKVMRRAIRAAWLDLDPGDLSSLDDPHTLEAIRAVALASKEEGPSDRRSGGGQRSGGGRS